MTTNGQSQGHGKANPLDEGVWLFIDEGSVAKLGRVANPTITERQIMADHDKHGSVLVSLSPVYVFETAYVPMQRKGAIAGMPLAIFLRQEQKFGLPEPLPALHMRATKLYYLSEMGETTRRHFAYLISAAEDNLRQQWSPIAMGSSLSGG